MQTVLGHYDGNVIVPHGRVDLPVGKEIEFQVVDCGEAKPQPAARPVRPFVALARELEREGITSDLPPDYAAQIDHYLYGTPKRP
jgi:hypothetical protein